MSVLKLSELKNNNPTNRIDSEFFKKEYIELFKLISESNSNKLEEVTSWITQGPNPKFQSTGIPCLTGRNINKGRVSYSNPDFVSSNEYQNLIRFQLSVGDTLITLKGKGSIGKIGFVTSDRQAIFSRDIGIVRPNGIDSAYVNAYILSKFGSKLIERGETGGTGQSTLTVSYLKNLDVIRLNIESHISDLIIRSEETLEKSISFYKQAEQMLLEEVGLADFVPSRENVNIKSYQDSFAATGRLDAEYYQPKYEQVEQVILGQEHTKIENVVLKIDTGEYASEYFQSNEKEGLVFYIRSTDMKNGQVEIDENHFVPLNEFNRIAQEGDILTSRVGSVGLFAEVRSDTSGSVYSDNVIAFTLPKTFIPSVYTLLFNSKYYFELIDRLARGSVQQRLNQETLKQLSIPIIDETTQQSIAQKVEESFALKAQSEQLLSLAQAAVELAIEQGEEVAMTFIETEWKKKPN